MTLADLIRKATEIQRQFNSSQIPLHHGDQEVSFDLEVKPPRGITDPWIVKIVNYKEETK